MWIGTSPQRFLSVLLAVAVPLIGLIWTFFTFGEAPRLEPLDVQYMLRGYFRAGSKIKDDQALGGFGTSDNLPRELGEDPQIKHTGLALLAFPEDSVSFQGEALGFRVMLANATGEVVALSASDSRLSIVREALDAEGEWRPIEYLPSSWCGNSYHQVFLGADEYWEFAAPIYSGRLPTRMRFKLADAEEGVIYSNEFEGWVNAEQFTEKEGHTPTSIMDPYDD